MPKNNFPKNLKYLRIKNMIYQKQLAEKLHITRQTISNYERSERICDLDMLIDIADVFGISVDELVG